MTCPAIGSATRNKPAVAIAMLHPGSTAAASAIGKNAAMMLPMKGTKRIRPEDCPKDGIGHADHQQPDGDDEPEASIEKGLHEKEPAERLPASSSAAVER